MNTGKVYQDSRGNDCSIMQMVRREPDWAANRIQEGEKAIERLAEIEYTIVDDECRRAQSLLRSTLEDA